MLIITPALMEFCKLNMIFAPGLKIKLLFADKKDQKIETFLHKGRRSGHFGQVNKKAAPKQEQLSEFFI